MMVLVFIQDKNITVTHDGVVILHAHMPDLRDVWESTSFELEKLQCNPVCVAQEQGNLHTRRGAQFNATFCVQPTNERIMQLPAGTKHSVAIIRQEGSNGDRELCSAFYAAGLQPWDVSMHDLATGKL